MRPQNEGAPQKTQPERANYANKISDQFTGIIGAMFTLKRLFAIFLFVLLTACSNKAGGSNLPGMLVSPSPVPPTDTPQPPTATLIPLALTVNDESISLDEFNAELARYKAAQTALGNTVSDQDVANSVLDDLISQLLLAQGAAEAGFTLADAALQSHLDALSADLGGADKLSAWQQAHGYSEAGFRSALKRATEAAWMRDKIISAVSSTAEQVHVRQILLYNEDSAKYYYERLTAGEDFDALAAEVEFAHGRPVTHGDLGWFPRGYLTEKTVEDAAFSLEAGKYSEVIKSEVGFHIIKVIERQADRPLSPDALLTLQNRALTDWLASRRQQSNIVLTPK
jgi:peptidyl-prolyl cis-trans isomerase C